MRLQKESRAAEEPAQRTAAKRPSNVRTGTATLFGRAAIYAHISLDKVGEAGDVGPQIDACRRLAELEGWSIDEGLTDNGLSA